MHASKLVVLPLEIAQSLLIVTVLLSVVIAVCHFVFSPKVPRIVLSEGRVIITGGSTGIGLEIARRCLRKGASVLIIARNSSKLDKAHSELSELLRNEQSNQGIYTLSVDVSDYDAMQTAVKGKLAELGWEWVSAVVCNAGVELLGRMTDLDVRDYRRVMDVNYFGTIHTIKVCLPWLKKKSAQASDARRIVIVSSMLGVMGLMFYSGYAASKHALTGLAHSLSHELRAFDIYTCIVYPPDTKTESYAREAQVYMPDPVRAISKEGGVFEAAQVGGDIAETIEHGTFVTAWGLDGWLVTNLTAGMGLPSSLGNSLFQGLFGGLTRIVGMFYAKQWCDIAERHLGYDRPPLK